MTINLDDHVVWQKGAIGLNGKVIGFKKIDGAEPAWNLVVTVKTKYGDLDEFPKNLRRV